MFYRILNKYKNKKKINTWNRFKNDIYEKVGFIQFEKDCVEIFKDRFSQENIRYASSRFFEFLDRLVLRYVHLRTYELELSQSDYTQRPVKDIQKDLINTTEAFHQHVYATLSALLKLSTILDENKLTGRSKKSVSTFLNTLDNNIITQDGIKNLKDSINNYRVSYIDHTIKNKRIHDWSTFCNSANRCFVQYFTPSSNGKLKQIPNKYIGIADTNFKIFTSRMVESVYIPPDAEDVLKELFYLTYNFLKTH